MGHDSTPPPENVCWLNLLLDRRSDAQTRAYTFEQLRDFFQLDGRQNRSADSEAARAGGRKPLDPVEKEFVRYARDLAARALGSYVKTLGDYIIETAPGVLWEKTGNGYDPLEGAYEPWAWRVLVNWANDEVDRKPATLPSADDDEPGDSSGSETAEQYRERLREIRLTLDRVDLAQGREQANFLGVFLLQIRLIIMAELVKRKMVDGKEVTYSSQGLACLSDNLADVAAWAMPWHAHEGAKPLREGGWPTNDAIWQQIVIRVEAAAYVRDQQSLCEIVTSLLGDGRRLTVDVWQQWLARAKEGVRKAIGEARWRRLFGQWFPDRKRGDRQSPRR